MVQFGTPNNDPSESAEWQWNFLTESGVEENFKQTPGLVYFRKQMKACYN